MAQRIQRRRTAGWRIPENAVYVGRPTTWGNPFKVSGLFRTPGPWGGPASPYHGVHGEGEYPGFKIERVRDEAHAVDLFGPYVRHHDDMWPPELIRSELGGKDLACWCRLDRPCHADTLLAIANDGVSAEAHEEISDLVHQERTADAQDRYEETNQ